MEPAFPPIGTAIGKLGPVYDSDIRADMFPQSTSPDLYGVDPYDCSGDSSGWDEAHPNEFDTLFVQGIYQNDMWKSEQEKEDAFAERTVFMVGTHSAGLASLDAGLGETMPTTGAEVEKYQFTKYAVGALNQGAHLKGGRIHILNNAQGNPHAYGDTFNTYGSANFGWLAFSATDDREMPDWNDPVGSYGPAVVGSVRGSENHAFIGKRIAGVDETTGDIVTGVDARAFAFKESDKWAPGSAVVTNAYGTIGSAWVDMAKSDLQVIPGKAGISGADVGGTAPYADRGRYAGYIGQAIGTAGYITAFVKDSYVNVDRASGLQSALIWATEPTGASDNRLEKLHQGGGTCEDQEPCLSVIRSYIGHEQMPISDPLGNVLDPNHDCDTESLVENSVGIFVYDQKPNSGGGSELQNAKLIHSFEKPIGESVTSVEKRAGIINRGNTVLGDGVGVIAGSEEVGYSTDVVHVRDVLHLAPRTAPPEIKKTVSSSDRAGLMYFDASRGTLRVSVPFRGELEETTGVEWQDDAIAWVDLKLDLDTVRPEDIVLNDSESFDPETYYDEVNYPEDGGPEFQAFVEDGVARAKAEATGETATSPYIAPTIYVADAEKIDNSNFLLTLKITGFRRLHAEGGTANHPEVHFMVRSRVASDTESFSVWKITPDVFLMPEPPQGSVKNPGDEFYQVVISSSEIRAGSIINLMAMNPNNAVSAGTSFVAY